MSNNEELYEMLEKYVAGGSSTGSKRATLQPEEPSVIARGRGCRVWDADGKEYIDYRGSLGPITLGYCYEEVDQAVKDQLDSGIIYGHPGILEAVLAKELCEVIPCAEKVRFLKTGGEAVAACIKLARAYTGCSHIIQIGYNGWLNVLSSGARMNPKEISKGIPKGVSRELSSLHHTVMWNDKGTIEKLFRIYKGKIAAVVVAADYADIESGRSFYPFLREVTKLNDALLIFDEIVTGFRIALAGVQEYFNVTPDLAIFAKGLANGMPLSVFCGRAEIMDEISRGTSISSTYGGELLSMAAALTVIKIYQRDNVIDYLRENGNRLWETVNKLFFNKGIEMKYIGMGQCPILSANDKEMKEKYFRSAYKEGISMYNVNYINFSHLKKDIDDTIEKLDKVVAGL